MTVRTGIPELDFSVDGVAVREHAAVPTLAFRIGVASRTGEPVRAIALHAQVRIAPRMRDYSEHEQRALVELFAEPARWGETLQPLPWTESTLLVGAFDGATTVELPIVCTYDFEIASTKYFHHLAGGDVPLEFLFSGTVFYGTPGGLQVAPIPWDRDAEFRMPVSTWQRLMDHYFPNRTWLRLGRDVFDRLERYRVQRGLSGWDEAFGALLAEAEA